MAQRDMNTMSEALSGAITTLSEAMAYPDADLEWLQSMIMELVNKQRAGNPSIPGEPSGQGGPQMPGASVMDLMGPGAVGPAPQPMSMAPGLPGGMGGMGGSMGGGGRPPLNTDDLGRALSM